MSDFKYDENGERVFNLPWATLGFDDGPLTLDYFDTVLMEYRSDPQFNHVVWSDQEGHFHRINLEPEAFAKLNAMNFRKMVEIIPSKDTEDWFMQCVLEDVNIELLTVPKEWTSHE